MERVGPKGVVLGLDKDRSMTGFREHLTSGLAVAAFLALAACSGPEATPPAAPAPEAAAPPAAQAPPPAVVAPAESPTIGGDGSAIQLSALSGADMEAQPLTGELGCSFSTGAASPLLVAMGNVGSREPAQGLVKVADSVERIAAPGGFDGMLKGAVFSGAGKTIRIAVTGPATGGGESPPSPATLTYQRADGASRTFMGDWTCGP